MKEMVKFNFFISILMMFSVSWSQAQSDSGQLIVNVINISSDNGQMIIALHDSVADFPKSPVLKIMGSIQDGKSTVSFNQLKYGSYAITVIHDENLNGKMDFNFFHIPSEDVAASNNAKGFFGPPSFSDAKIEIRSMDVRHTIRLK